jgi:hypothetical protein
VQIEKKYAILIGVDDYFDDIIQGLKYSVADVKSFYDILADSERGGYNSENIRLFTDKSSQPELLPTRNNIMSQLSSLASMATTKDNLLVYFSGHGIEQNDESYLLPQDARYNILNESAISIKWMKKVLVSSNARVKIVILDACHSGAIKGKATSGYMTESFRKDIFPPPEGFAVLSSCKMNEVSWEDDELKHGVFSYFLTDGLKGGADYDRDLKVTIMDTSKYTFEKVSSWALAHSRNQSPTLECSIYGDVVLCQVPSQYVPPEPTEIAVTKIRLSSELFKRESYNEQLGKVCGLLMNFIEPDSISIGTEDKVKFAVGEIVKKEMGTIACYLDIFFDYDIENRENVDMIISRLDDNTVLKFDQIEFFFSKGIDVKYMVKSFRKRGFNILSFDPIEKSVEVEVPSELKDQETIIKIKEEEKEVSVLFDNSGDKVRFSPGFYARINPKTVMEFTTSMQK